ncbi:amidohydrolase [Stappia taiwanensis]|uniref:Amidohydrolase n=1 Tax=Stappia taiwanensis TaxID=992267 RepID=A0A838Y1S1_9HYPH|nr:M20 aminoacylase family protein [Stappia taiwanensis]MBA4612890.1 amidohydrolase [Stappia taiwanensis]GGF07024.1 amidohydrolase [Stappia taiwanensis]
MPTINRFADLAEEITEWRRDIHAHPELLYDTHRTAELVADKLKAFGVDEIATGIGRTGVVGVIRGRANGSGKVIGLRADMDALPLEEITGKPYASTIPGKMHACGHDGHTAMLLGAAKYLAETRNFDGTVIVIFQPAEEGGAGAKAMIDDGLMDRFGIQEVYGMHNLPGAPVGTFHIRPGSIMAAADRLQIDIEGKGCHAAKPHEGIDTILVGSHIVQAVQSIASRNADPLKSVVVSITTFNAGFTDNVIPQTATLRGTVRTLDPDIRDLAEARLKALVPTIAEAYGAKATVTYRRDYPITANHADQTDFAVSVARDIVGKDNVNTDIAPTMGGEDFSFMLEERPGAFIFAGNGDSAGLHHPAYDFNDELIPVGCSYWVKLVETAMPAA